MRILLFILVVLAAGVCVEKPAKAQNGAWCAPGMVARGIAGSQALSSAWLRFAGLVETVDPVRILPRQGHRVDVQGPKRLRLA